MSKPSPSCPSCHSDLVAVDDAVAHLQVCSFCSGIWIDVAQLELEGATLPADLCEVSSAGKRTCPRCKESLRTYRGALVEIDSCDACSGIFLDSGELELLVQARQPAAPDDAPAPAEEGPPAFFCELCHQRTPLTDQVIGELLTVCGACAEKQDIPPDPMGRRKAIAAKRALGAQGTERNTRVDAGWQFYSSWGGSSRSSYERSSTGGLLGLLFELL